MKNYKQITLRQRYQIESLLQAGLSQTAIALILAVNKSTFSRELKRNVAKRGRTAHVYKAENAQSKTALRHRYKTKQVLLTESLKKRIESLLQGEKWSPELIAKRLSLESDTCVSHETIYKWIWKCKHSNHRKHRPYKKLYTYLRHTGRRQKRKNTKDN